MMNKYNYCFLLLLLLGMSRSGTAQPLVDSLKRILENAAPSIYTTQGLSFGGASAALITPSGQVLTATSGQATPAVEMADTFRLGASDVTQTFMATLTLALMQEGKLMLNQPISAFNIGTLTNVPATTTIRQLLTHTSGLADFATNANYTSTILFDVSRNFTAAELTQLLVGAPSAPGTFRYANTNFLVLGLVLEAANGTETLQQSLQRLVLTPAGLTGIQFYQSPDPTNLAPLFADVFGSGFPQQVTPHTSVFTGAGAAGNIIATPRQMVQFLRALATGSILNAANLQQMLSFSASTGRLGSQYGLGIEQFNITVNGQQRTVIGHTGEINYVTVALYDPTDSVGVAMVSNNALATPRAVLDVAVRFFGAYRRLGTTSVDEAVLPGAQVRLYPNPTRQLLSLDFTLLQNARVGWSLYNLQGQLLRRGDPRQLSAGNYTERLEVAGLAPGTYLLRLETGSTGVTQKVIIR